MKISDIVVYEVKCAYAGPQYPPGDRQARQIDVYPEYNATTHINMPAPGDMLKALYLEIVTEEGVAGIFGPIEEVQAFLVLRQLRPMLLGQDALATERLYDQMVRIDRHGRSGLFMTAVSVVDCALWDLKGKAWGQPVYRLLGGPVRHEIPAYASMLAFSTDPEHAAATATEYKDMGYDAQKWFFRYGPADGDAGMAKNLAMARAVRDAVGETYTLMFDAFMGWSGKYAIAMAQELAPLRPYWLEEPVPPERVSTLRRIREASGIPVATGEHVYTRWQTKDLLVQEAADVLQNDPDWTGGISEQMRICALASSFEVPVIAHGHSLLPPLHVAAAQSPTTVPYVEYLVQFQETKQAMLKTIYRPLNGVVRLPEAPGLGMVLDEARLESKRPISISLS